MLPGQVFKDWKQKITKLDLCTFYAAIIMGFVTHMRIFLSDIPNHDGMSSLCFDQNMITSGRWFLRVACGISSDYTLPWVIGVLCVLYLAVAAVVLQRFFRIEHKLTGILIGAMLVVYPTLTSNFAYIFTADGYMLAFLLAIISVWCVENHRYGFVFGGIALGFSMGIYQAYLSVAMILAVYAVSRSWYFGDTIKEKIQVTWKYVAMGVIGAVSYYGMLQILLKLQHTELSGYQGIGDGNQQPLIQTLIQIYKDFVYHTFRGNIFVQHGILLAAMSILLILAVVILLTAMWKKGSFRTIWTYACTLVVGIVLPICFNVILLISPNVTYHSLMRYQWVMIPVIALAIIDRHGEKVFKNRVTVITAWVSLMMSVLVISQYVLICNIGYFNLEKKYEKTYAYCLRLLEQMEETEGYYHGMPVAMIGVVGDHYLPSTDITVGVTDSLIGVNGDYLFYTADNYQKFISYYFGVNIELVDIEDMVDIIQTEEYKELNAFPKANSMKVVDDILYIKTENKGE